VVFGSGHPASVQAFFEAAAARRMRSAAGKVLMDRNCPPYLRDTPEAGERATRELLAAWHGRERLLYAITPRFAPTSSDAQLASAGRLATDYPDALIQTHVAENLDEVAWVKRQLPEARTSLDVYHRYALRRARASHAP